jgi:very-short-patch-repair endonuclease
MPSKKQAAERMSSAVKLGLKRKDSGAGAPTAKLCERDDRGRMWWGVKMSTLERQFLNIWHHYDGPDLEREVAFDQEAAAGLKQSGERLAQAPRAWRADFVHRPTMTLIEVEGGAWSGGRHTRGAGFIEDATKYLRAWELGWNVLRLSEKQISAPDVRRIIARLRGGDAEKGSAPSWLQILPP